MSPSEDRDRFRGALLGLAAGDAVGAAVCGQIAGAFHGERGIPADWLTRLAKADLIRGLADALRSPQAHATVADPVR